MRALERPKYIRNKTLKPRVRVNAKPIDKTVYTETVWRVDFHFWLDHEYGEVDMEYHAFHFLSQKNAELFHKRLAALANKGKIEHLKIEAVENCSKQVKIESLIPAISSRWANPIHLWIN
ncbi:MAG: hypothetical protein RLZZ184_3232 [Cyanobacteriota bacterium]|jgi:hypothetical protein